MMKLSVLTLILFFPLAPALAQATSYAQRDVAVLSTIIADRCAYFAKHGDGKTLILSGEASAIEVTTFPSGFNRTAVQSLKVRNKGAPQLPHLSLCKGFMRVSGLKLQSLFKKSGWPGFHKAYPNASGTFSLSLPGYSLDGAAAIVQVSGACGGLCGSGFYWVLQYVNGKWVIVERSGAWIS